MSESLSDPDRPSRCQLLHPAFAGRDDIGFRRSQSDDQPAMVIGLGPREAVIPIRDLYRAFGIEADSADGRMLALIAEALAFVPSLRLGDLLPSELLTGEASWQPEPRHAALAAARLRLQLAALIEPSGGAIALADPEVMLRHADDPKVRVAVQRGFAQAAAELGLGSAEAVVGLVGEAAHELSYIEALRERLMAPLTALRGRLEALLLSFRGDATHREILARTLLLVGLAEQDNAASFTEIDKQTVEVMTFLRQITSQRGFIRAIRDRLYRNLRFFAALLDGWKSADQAGSERQWDLVLHTYHTLAPRFMPRQEWPLLSDAAGPRRRAVRPKPTASMTW